MIITFDWLKDHLKTNQKEKNLLEQLTNIGLEVESVESLSTDNELFKVAEIIKTEKHPNADRLRVCEVNIGENEIKKVVCGAKNAKECAAIASQYGFNFTEQQFQDYFEENLTPEQLEAVGGSDCCCSCSSSC